MILIPGYALMLAVVSLISKNLKMVALGIAPWGRRAWRDHLLTDAKVVLAALAVTTGLAMLSITPLVVAWNASLLLVSLLVAAEVYYYHRTGSHGDAYLLKRIFRQRSDLVLILREQGGRGAMVLLLSATIVVGIWHLGGILSLTVSLGEAFALTLGCALLALWAHYLGVSSPLGPCTDPLRRSATWSLFRDFFGEAPWYASSINARALALGAPSGMTEVPCTMPTVGTATRDNVLMIVMESARGFQHLPPGTMPFVEAVSRSGTYVPHCYSVVPHTTAAMIPLLAGIYPPLDSHPRLRDALPTVLVKHGYATAFFTPAALEFEDKGKLLANMGFQHRVGACELKAEAGTLPHYLGFHDEHVVPPLLAWMAQQASENKPFLATCLTLSSHHPYRFPAVEGDTLPAIAREQERYFAALRYTDRCVERIVQGLEDMGLRDQTWVVLVGDHGQAFGEHGRRYHSACLWEEGLSVPCVIAPPTGRELPATIAGVRSQLDLAPTLLAELGFPVPAHYAGCSLKSPPLADRELFHATWLENQSLCLRRGSLKFLYHHGQEPSQLYDLAEDPFEKLNLVDQLEARTRAELERDCLVWRRRLELAVTC